MNSTDLLEFMSRTNVQEVKQREVSEEEHLAELGDKGKLLLWFRNEENSHDIKQTDHHIYGESFS